MFFAPMLASSTLCRSFASVARPALRDPNRPKIPLSAYLRFAESYRKEKGLKGGADAMKQIGAVWKTLPEEKKKPFVAAYQVEKDKYAAAFQKYKDSGALDAWKRDPLRPKAPCTAFIRYLDEFRNSEKAKGLAVTVVSKEGAKAWKVADPAKKTTLERLYQKEKAVYTKALEEYKASGKEMNWKKKVGIWDAEQKELLKKQQEKDKKRQLAEKEKQKKIALAEKKKKEALKLKAKQQALRMREKEKAKRLKEREKQSKTKVTAASKNSKLGSVSNAAKKERERLVAAIDKEKKTLAKLTTQLKQKAAAQLKKLADMKTKAKNAQSPATKKVLAKKTSTTTKTTSARK